jgi:hypothetical protein
MPPPDHFDRMLADYLVLLPKMRDKFGKSNCPLTAEAVWKYFNTGNVVAARKIMDGYGTVVCQPAIRVTSKSLEALLLEQGHGAHGVVTANPDSTDRQHSLNAVNIRGKVYLVDAYNPQPVLTDDLRGHLKYAQRLEFTAKWDLRIVPNHALAGYKCVK